MSAQPDSSALAETTLPEQAEVVVLGGGPAGATVANLLAQHGRDVLLLEREPGPTFRIGESLMPETYGTFDRLGMLERLRASSSPVKASVQFVGESGRRSRPFYFFERKEGPSAYTWQVERAWFDQAMLDRASEVGANVCRGVMVKDVTFEADRAVGVSVSKNGGPDRHVSSRVIVDATGLSSLISRRLELRRRDPKLSKAAVFAHFEDGLFDEGVDAGATLVIHALGGRGWLWYIPLSSGRVSVGVVADPGELIRKGDAPEDVLDEVVRGCPEAARRLANARRVSPARVVTDYSYSAQRVSGDGWVLVGDAFSFIDPIYSSGVLLALKSGEMAADSIAAALEADDVSGKRLGTFGPELERGIEAIRRLVYAFYTPGFSFARFIRAFPQHQGPLVDLLIGDVFRPGAMDLFDDMEKVCDFSAGVLEEA
jgi:flavin-dependent dehydrogenase